MSCIGRWRITKVEPDAKALTVPARLKRLEMSLQAKAKCLQIAETRAGVTLAGTGAILTKKIEP